MISEHEQERLTLIVGERARDNVSELMFPIDRTAGSEAETIGAKKIHEKLAQFVDSCELEAVPVTTYLKTESRLEVVSPIRFSIPCTPARLTGSGSGTVTLVDAANGTKEDYDRLPSGVENAAVLATCQKLRSYQERCLMALEARHRKASCIISNLPEKDDELAQVHIGNVDFPSLCISNRSAAELRELLSQRKEVTVRFESVMEHTESNTYNVVGTIIGTQLPNEVIYLTGHHDSWFYGANDNISTVACLLEVARMFYQYRPRHTIKFIVFGSEESGARAEAELLFGLTGSLGYSEAHRSDLNERSDQTAVVIINGEMMGTSERINAICSAELLPTVREAVADLGHYASAAEPDPSWTLSDHFSFHTLGVPAVLFWLGEDSGTGNRSPWYRVYHTDHDNLDLVKPTALARNASLMALLSMRFDSADMPYSLEALRDTALRQIDLIQNGDQIRKIYDDKAGCCLEATEHEEKVRRVLGLVRTVNTNLYTLVGTAFFNKFGVISEAIDRLRDARNIVELENDISRAHSVLSTIPHAKYYINWSKEVTDYVNQMTRYSKGSSRLSPYLLDLRDVFAAIDRQESPHNVLPLIEAKLDEALKIAEEWRASYVELLMKL